MAGSSSSGGMLSRWGPRMMSGNSPSDDPRCTSSLMFSRVCRDSSNVWRAKPSVICQGTSSSVSTTNRPKKSMPLNSALKIDMISGAKNRLSLRAISRMDDRVVVLNAAQLLAQRLLLLGSRLHRAAVGRLTPRLPGIDSFFQLSRHDAFLSLQLRRLSCLILSFRARGAGPSGMGGMEARNLGACHTGPHPPASPLAVAGAILYPNVHVK